MDWLKIDFFKRQNSYVDKIKLRLESKEKINEIESLKEEVMNNEDKLLIAETKKVLNC